MAVEIRELIIKTTIDNTSGKNEPASKDGDSEGKSSIVQECVEQVMDILNRQKER